MIVCQDCRNTWKPDEIVPLDDVPDLVDRIHPGEIVPSGACPGCGALCHAMTGQQAAEILMDATFVDVSKIRDHLGHASELTIARYADDGMGNPEGIYVECHRCQEVVVELYSSQSQDETLVHLATQLQKDRL